MNRSTRIAASGATAALLAGAAAWAAETVTYSYDVLGRLKATLTAGGPPTCCR